MRSSRTQEKNASKKSRGEKKNEGGEGHISFDGPRWPLNKKKELLFVCLHSKWPHLTYESHFLEFLLERSPADRGAIGSYCAEEYSRGILSAQLR
jgi:hypothetical protein